MIIYNSPQVAQLIELYQPAYTVVIDESDLA